jgi:phage terminase large subunit
MTLSFTGHPKQIEAYKYWIDTTTNEIVWGGGKNGGKSYLGASLIFGDALIYPETSYFIVREELNDLRKFLIPTVQELFYNWKIDILKYAKFNGQDNLYRLYNGSIVYLLECKYKPSDPMFERFGSMQMTRGWIEEAGETNYLAYENLKLSLGRKNNDKYGLKRKLLMTCNPKKNYLYRNFYQPFKNSTLPEDKKFIQSLVTDNLFRQSGAIDILDNIQDKTAKARLRYGDWEYDDDPAKLIEYESIINVFRNTHIGGGKKCITIDVARKGRDASVITIWDGYRAIEVISIGKGRITDLAAVVNKYRGKYGIPATNVCADEDGVGGGLVDILDCVGFINNSKPVELLVDGKKENFDNLRSQCIYKFAEKVNRKEIYINTNDQRMREMIIEELECIKLRSIENDGKISIIGREGFVKLIQRSPDHLSSMMQRIYLDIGKQNIIKSWG